MRNFIIFLIVVMIIVAVGTYFYVMMGRPASPPATTSPAPATTGTPG